MAKQRATEQKGASGYKASYAWSIHAWANRVEEAAISAYVNSADPKVAKCVLDVLRDAYQECRDCYPGGGRDPEKCDMGYEEDEDGYCVPIGS